MADQKAVIVLLQARRRYNRNYTVDAAAKQAGDLIAFAGEGA